MPSPGYHGLNFAETFGEYAFLMRARVEVLRDVGASLSPMNAWLLVQGLETLALRMPQHVANARAVASFLRDARGSRLGVVRRSARQPGARARGALSCRWAPARCSPSACAAGARRGARSSKALELWSHLANVGDAKSLVIHPASTTHQQLCDDEMRAAGVGPEMVRLSVGLEDADDLIWDLEHGLAAARKSAEVRA